MDLINNKMMVVNMEMIDSGSVKVQKVKSIDEMKALFLSLNLKPAILVQKKEGRNIERSYF